MVKLLEFLATVALVTSGLSTGVPKDLPWSDLVISSSPYGRYLYRTKTGGPFFWIADTNWELFHKLNRIDVDLYQADPAANCFI